MDLLSIFHQLEWWLYPSLSNLVIDFKVFQALFSGPCTWKNHTLVLFTTCFGTQPTIKRQLMFCIVLLTFIWAEQSLKMFWTYGISQIHQEASLGLTLLINLVFWSKCWCNGPYSRWSLFQIFKESFIKLFSVEILVEHLRSPQ